MKMVEQAWDALPDFLPLLATGALVIGGLWLIDQLMRRRAMRKGAAEVHFSRQILMLILTIIGLILVILAAPTTPETRNQLLGLLGVALTAIIALSSTTFVANAMAGILLRSMSRFRPGDFIRVGDYLGRVTERGLFHTEVQTEDRDLATFPNFYLISNPIKVVRSSGTIISATVSLGYDVPHARVRELLINAAEASGLQEPFTQILDLGDFSITYRVAGFLEDVKLLISAPSKLRAAMLDALHGADIEIVSPNFMIQRQQRPEVRVIASADLRQSDDQHDSGEHAVMFDKAEAAGQVEDLKKERESLLADIEVIKESLNGAEDGERARIERSIRFRESRLESIGEAITRAEESLKEEA